MKCEKCLELEKEIRRLKSIISDIEHNLSCVDSSLFEHPATWDGR